MNRTELQTQRDQLQAEAERLGEKRNLVTAEGKLSVDVAQKQLAAANLQFCNELADLRRQVLGNTIRTEQIDKQLAEIDRAEETRQRRLAALLDVTGNGDAAELLEANNA